MNTEQLNYSLFYVNILLFSNQFEWLEKLILWPSGIVAGSRAMYDLVTKSSCP